MTKMLLRCHLEKDSPLPAWGLQHWVWIQLENHSFRVIFLIAIMPLMHQPGAVVACTLDGGARNKRVPLQLCCLQEDEQRGVQ